jgi:hypothetical protein
VVRLIDHGLRSVWERYKITPSHRIDDHTFIRRASLDIIGRIPRPDEIRRFLDDPPDSRRALLVEDLLAGKEYASRWAELWSGWLLGGARPAGRDVYRDELTAWLEGQLARNRPYHELARALLTAEGNNNQNGAVSFVLAHLGQRVPAGLRTEDGQFDMVPLTVRIHRVFLGVAGDCFQCHNHPFQAGLRQEHFWAVNALLRQVEVKGDPVRGRQSGEALTVRDNPKAASRGFVLFDQRNGIVRPAKQVEVKKFSFLPTRLKIRPAGISRRESLARALLDDEQSSRALVNRMWAMFFGRGFVQPVDDFADINEPSHPELLDELAVRFRRANQDLKELIRWICLSEAYQFSHVANRSNGQAEHELLFSRKVPRPMSPTQLYESLRVATGAEVGQSKDAWLAQLFLSDGEQYHACGKQSSGVDLTGSMTQALILMNDQRINTAIASAKGTAARAVAGLDSPRLNDAAITELYLVALSRPPRPAELKFARRLREMLRERPEETAPKDSPKDQAEDLLWALLNSGEFLLNH